MISGFAGFLGTLASNPFELVMVRQIYDGALPKNQRRNYKHVFDGVRQIASSEGGYNALWKGFVPTAAKMIALNMSYISIRILF